MSNATSENQPINEPDFVAIYGEYPVSLEGLPKPITVNFALSMEDAFCTASPEARSDEAARLKRLAGFVGRQALKPEHQWLLPETQN